MNQDATQDSLLGGGGNGGSTTTSYASGTTVPKSGTYKTENKYLVTVGIFGAGDKFTVGPDGKKCSWVALNSSTTSSSGGGGDGSFTSVKVLPGTDA